MSLAKISISVGAWRPTTMGSSYSLVAAVVLRLEIQQRFAVRSERAFEPPRHFLRQRRLAVQEIGQSRAPDPKQCSGLRNRDAPLGSHAL